MSKQAYSHYLLEVKQEYTKQLSNMLVPVMYEGLMSIYNEAKKIKKESPMKTFQILLSRIPQWNQNIINNEYQRIISKTQCDWINDLITAVFISHAKILSSIKTKKKSKTLNLKIPNGDYFIHKAYIECARQFWKNPYLFYDDVNTIEYQRNMRETELIIEQSINETIRKLLPVKNILQQYITLDESESDSSSEEETEEEQMADEAVENKPKKKAVYDEEYITSSITKKDKDKLERSVKKEIQRANPSRDDDDNYSTISVSHEIPARRSAKPKQVINEEAEEEKPVSRPISIEKVPSLVIEDKEPSKLREEHDLYGSLNDENSHDISLAGGGDDEEELKHYPPPVESINEDEYREEPSREERKSISISKNSLMIEKDDMDEFDRMSMNTKLDITYQPPEEEESEVLNIGAGSLKIDIEEVPRIDEPSISHLDESVRSEPVAPEQPVASDIKKVYINMPQQAQPAQEQQSRPAFAHGKKRETRKNYSFFE